jgi:hypothetical protein
VQRGAQRQLDPGAVRQPCRPDPGTDKHLVVLGRPIAPADLDGGGARRSDRHHLVEHDPVGEGGAQHLDRDPSPDHAAVLVEQ